MPPHVCWRQGTHSCRYRKAASGDNGVLRARRPRRRFTRAGMQPYYASHRGTSKWLSYNNQIRSSTLALTSRAATRLVLNDNPLPPPSVKWKYQAPTLDIPILNTGTDNLSAATPLQPRALHSDGSRACLISQVEHGLAPSALADEPSPQVDAYSYAARRLACWSAPRLAGAAVSSGPRSTPPSNRAFVVSKPRPAARGCYGG